MFLVGYNMGIHRIIIDKISYQTNKNMFIYVEHFILSYEADIKLGRLMCYCATAYMRPIWQDKNRATAYLRRYATAYSRPCGPLIDDPPVTKYLL